MRKNQGQKLVDSMIKWQQTDIHDRNFYTNAVGKN